MLKICTTPLLTQELPEFDFEKNDAKVIERKLIKAMTENNGAGLAANQVGKDWRVFVADFGGEPKGYFNPKILEYGDDTEVSEEGCLSFPHLWIKIKRSTLVIATWQDSNGQRYTRPVEGRAARVFQHETDHLDGITFQRRANRFHLEQAKKRQKIALRRIGPVG